MDVHEVSAIQVHCKVITATLNQLNDKRFPSARYSCCLWHQGEVSSVQGVWLHWLCSSSLSCGGLSWAFDSRYLQTALRDGQLLFESPQVIDHLHPAKNIPELDPGNKGVCVCVWRGGWRGVLSSVVHTISKATGDTLVKWYQDKELFL